MMTNSQQCKPTSCQGPVAAVQCKDVQATILLPLFASPDRSTCAAVLEVVQASPQEPQFLHLAGAASKALAVRRPAGVDLAGSASCPGRWVLRSLSWWSSSQAGLAGPHSRASCSGCTSAMFYGTRHPGVDRAPACLCLLAVVWHLHVLPGAGNEAAGAVRTAAGAPLS